MMTKITSTLMRQVRRWGLHRMSDISLTTFPIVFSFSIDISNGEALSHNDVMYIHIRGYDTNSPNEVSLYARLMYWPTKNVWDIQTMQHNWPQYHNTESIVVKGRWSQTHSLPSVPGIEMKCYKCNWEMCFKEVVVIRGGYSGTRSHASTKIHTRWTQFFYREVWFDPWLHDTV